jgi:soluble cytochrome b562
VIYDPRPTFRTKLRAYLGTDIGADIAHHIHNLEVLMAKVIDLLNGLVAQQTAASAAQATSFHNLQNAITRLEQSVKDGDASAEVEAAVNDLRAGFDTLQQAAVDADNGYEPAETPTDTNPVVEPDADGDVIPDETGRNAR